MANLLAKCGLQEARGYNSRLIRIRETVSKKGKEQKTKDMVYLNLYLDGSEEESLSEVIQNGVGIADVVTVEDWNSIPNNLTIPESMSEGVLQTFVDYEDRFDALNELPKEFRVIARLPKSTKGYDVFSLAQECKSHPNLRFTGNTMLMVEGLKVGRFDAGDLFSRQKANPDCSVSDIFDDLEEVELGSLEGIEEGSSPKTRRTATGKSKPKAGMDEFVDLDDVTKKASSKSKTKPKAPTKADLRRKLLAARGARR